MNEAIDEAKTRGTTTWSGALRNGLWSGSAASLATTAVLASRGDSERRDPYGPLNGPSQWVWGKSGAYKRGFSVRHTVAGYLIHHAMSIFWATLFEKAFGRRVAGGSVLETVGCAAATSLMACIVDYKVVPGRFTPGFEKQLSRTSMAFTYGAFALALAAAALLARRS
jgi:hypothetical protein